MPQPLIESRLMWKDTALVGPNALQGWKATGVIPVKPDRATKIVAIVSSINKTKNHLSAIDKFRVSLPWNNVPASHQIFSDCIEHATGWGNINAHNQDLGLECPQVESHCECETRAVVISWNRYDVPSVSLNIVEQFHVA
jgi:hypothetical protein